MLVDEASRGWRRAHFAARSRAEGSGACRSGRWARCRSRSSWRCAADWYRRAGSGSRQCRTIDSTAGETWEFLARSPAGGADRSAIIRSRTEPERPENVSNGCRPARSSWRMMPRA